MLLRQQLQRMSHGEKAKRGARAGKSPTQQRKSAAKRIAELSEAWEFGDEELARMLVRALLVNEFGESVANDHKFQKLSDEVHRMLTADPQARKIVQQAIGQVRTAR